ncbi:3-deoxy-manno-octulosonate cytidylyltransferase [Rossellomorea arthrocnemi]
MKVVCVIPSRFGSTRFPGKPLALIKGKSMIQHVYNRVRNSNEVDEIVIATDHHEIANEVKKFGGKVVMTSEYHQSGSDRIAEVAEEVEGDIYLNVQGDEPLIHPELIDEIVRASKRYPTHVITAKTKISSNSDITNPNVVKVVTNNEQDALYFSRSQIPFRRNEVEIDYYKHLGIYCYPAKILKEYVTLPKSSLELVESLEQLRLLENGYSIKVLETSYDAVGVDTPEDINKVELLLEEISNENSKA